VQTESARCVRNSVRFEVRCWGASAHSQGKR
jgi:hypothetical protein